MLKTEPYFMTNPEWYYHDKEKMKYFLTDKAPKEAIESYHEFYDDDYDLCADWALSMATKDIIEEMRAEGKSEEEIQAKLKILRG